MLSRYRFGRFELRPEDRLLLLDGQPALLGGRAFDVLLALVEHRHRLLTKAELLQYVWHEQDIAENNLHAQISALRGVLGARAIATVAGRGYRFALELDDEPPRPPVASAAAAQVDAELEWPREPLRFGTAVLRARERRLDVDGRPANLGSRAFELLLLLVRLRPRIVSKNEILDRVWPGVFVAENNLQTQVSTLRKVLGPNAIETIPGRGYRFVAVVAESADALAPVQAAAPCSEVPAPHLPQQHLTNLPAVAEALFGRTRDIENLVAMVTEHRLVTVAGPGGIGKTSVAQAVGRQLQGRYANGVWWVDLASVSAAGNIALALANAANVQLAGGEPLTALTQALASREMLLLLDNCESRVDEIAMVVQAALAAAPELRLLATSQEALKAADEQLYRLSALGLPPPEACVQAARTFAALQLFEHRARTADHQFSLTGANVTTAVRLCRRLDGNALAIEMAAARLPLLGLQALEANLAERLRILKGNRRLAPLRQQTLRATLDWSHALLSPQERAVLRRLSAFAGVFSLDMARQVAATQDIDEWSVLDALAGLVDKSLIQVEPCEPPRYRLLETTRLYAAERLAEHAEATVVQQRHALAMQQVAEACEAAYWTTPDGAWLAAYVPYYDDLQAAFERACEQRDAEVGASTLDALFRLNHLRAILPPIQVHVQAATALLPSACAMSRARLLTRMATHFIVARPERLSQLTAASEAVDILKLLDDPPRLFEATLSLAVVHAIDKQVEQADKLLQDANALEDQRWPPRLHWLGAFYHSRVSIYRGDSALYLASVRKELELAQQAGSPCQVLNARANLGDAALMAGEWDEAIALAQVALEESRVLNLPQLHAITLVNLCGSLIGKGDLSRVQHYGIEALTTAKQNQILNYLLCHLVWMAAQLEDFQRAVLLLGYLDIGVAANHFVPEPSEVRAIQMGTHIIEKNISPSQSARWRQAGSMLNETQVFALAGQLIADTEISKAADTRPAQRS